MRRPLRFLIEALGLDDAQASEVAKAFDALRLERAASELDAQRARSRTADLVEAEVLDRAAVEEAAEQRVAAARRERDALVALITRLHATLRPDQRARLATLLRTGPLAL